METRSKFKTVVRAKIEHELYNHFPYPTGKEHHFSRRRIKKTQYNRSLFFSIDSNKKHMRRWKQHIQRLEKLNGAKQIMARRQFNRTLLCAGAKKRKEKEIIIISDSDDEEEERRNRKRQRVDDDSDEEEDSDEVLDDSDEENSDDDEEHPNKDDYYHVEYEDINGIEHEWENIRPDGFDDDGTQRIASNQDWRNGEFHVIDDDGNNYEGHITWVPTSTYFRYNHVSYKVAGEDWSNTDVQNNGNDKYGTKRITKAGPYRKGQRVTYIRTDETRVQNATIAYAVPRDYTMSEVIVIDDSDESGEEESSSSSEEEESSSEEDSSEEEAGSSSGPPPLFDTTAARFLVLHYDAYKNKTLQSPTDQQYTKYLHKFRRYIKQHGNVVEKVANQIPTTKELEGYEDQDKQQFTLPAKLLIEGSKTVVMEDTANIEVGQYVSGTHISVDTTVKSTNADASSIVISRPAEGTGKASLTFSTEDDAELYPTGWKKREVIQGYVTILSKLKQAKKTCLGMSCTKQIPYNQEDRYCAKCRTNMEKVPNAQAAYFARFQTDLAAFKATFNPPGGGSSSGITYGEHIKNSPFIKFLKQGRGTNGRYLAQRSDRSFIDLTLPNEKLKKTLSPNEFGTIKGRTMESEYNKKLRQLETVRTRIKPKQPVYMLKKGRVLPNGKRESDTYYTWYNEGNENDIKKIDVLIEHEMSIDAYRDTILDLSDIHTLQWRDNEGNKRNVLDREVSDDTPLQGKGFKLSTERMVSENGIFKIVQTHRRRGKTWAQYIKREKDLIGTEIDKIVPEKKATTNNGSNRFEIKLKAYDKQGAEQRFKPYTFVGKNISTNKWEPHDWVFNNFKEFEWVTEIRPDKGYGVREW